MRPINVTLDATTWELAKKKPNFSSWVRDQLRSERNKKEGKSMWCRACRARPVKSGNAYCRDCQIDMGFPVDIFGGEEE